MQGVDQRTDYRRIGVLTAAAVTAARQHGPAVRLRPLDACLQQARLADARLTGHQQDWRAICQQLVQQDQFLGTPHKRQSSGAGSS